jgi:hypothetical protein
MAARRHGPLAGVIEASGLSLRRSLGGYWTALRVEQRRKDTHSAQRAALRTQRGMLSG